MTSLRFALPLAAFLTAVPAHAAPPQPLFASEAPIRITIQAPLKKLMADRAFDGSVAGTLTDPNGLKLPAQFKLRGITRRTAEICDFAPLRIDLSGTVPATSVFAGQNKLKLVTHCKSNSAFQQKVLLEYATYAMFNQLTPLSMRARLATVDYVDADGRPIISRTGFFLEDVGDIAKRNDTGQVRAGTRIPTNWLNPTDAARYALYMHLIANHDWSMRAGPAGDNCCHNAELVGVAAPGKVVPIPYDFDFSGLVDAPYATAPEQIGITSVRQRRYRGYCLHSPQAAAVAAEFRQKRAAMTAALDRVPGMEPTTRTKAVKFMDGFYAQISDQRGVDSLLKSCIG